MSVHSIPQHSVCACVCVCVCVSSAPPLRASEAVLRPPDAVASGSVRPAAAPHRHIACLTSLQRSLTSYGAVAIERPHLVLPG
mmetsp:Transcript_21050/g.58421  ORF Transcript_21050/g.58421 Transcript_21050/m.58421 type:complete len:83 (-) Transcript_21050:92-340(-)